MDGIRRLLGFFLILVASYFGLSVKAIIILAISTLIFVFVVLPSVFHFNTYIQRQMIFLTWVKWPKLVDFDHPEREGLNGTINYYLETEPDVRIGVWHVLPEQLTAEGEGKSQEWYLESLSRGPPMVLYMHGNTGSRARDHRMDLYHVLRKLNYHVVAFDYRGYADSSRETPTKRGVVTDGHAIYAHLKKHAKTVPVIVWGHSLGTAVSSQVVSDLSLAGNPPTALVLESPFNNIRDEIRHHPFTFLWKKMPWFDWFFTGSLKRSDVAFFSDEVVKNIHIPILIIHARDDQVVPFLLGEKLYQAAKASRVKGSSKPLFFVPFHEDLAYAHVLIHRAPELPNIVQMFMKKAIADVWDRADYNDNGELLL